MPRFKLYPGCYVFDLFIETLTQFITTQEVFERLNQHTLKPIGDEDESIDGRVLAFEFDSGIKANQGKFPF